MTAVIDARELRKRFPGGGNQAIEAVRGVSLRVARGEIVGFLGPNGAGKTTTLRMLTTLLPIDGGSATVAGLDVGSQPGQVRARIGYVSQLGGADELATGRENLTLQGRLYGGSRTDVARRVGEMLERFDLAGFADRRVRTYSGGQRRRLDVALGVVHEPEILFLDEPTSGIDPLARRAFWRTITALAQAGVTVVVTTHFMEEAEYCDRIAIQDAGEMLALGTPRQVREQAGADRGADMNDAFIAIVEKGRAQRRHAGQERAG
jgi:ABC-2 type transport system ATP-binding protein